MSDHVGMIVRNPPCLPVLLFVTASFLGDLKVYVYIYIYLSLVGGFIPSEKYESQLGLLFPIYVKIKNVPNHQPDIIYIILTKLNHPSPKKVGSTQHLQGGAPVC